MHGSLGSRRISTRWLGLAAVALTLIAGVGRLGAQSVRPDSSGTIVGLVTTQEGALPLGYSVVSVASLGREQFANERGEFVLAGLPAGVARVRVRHLGYVPADLDVTVRAGVADTIRVALVHITVRLSAVLVHAYPPCVNPGAPKVSDDSAFATIFDQLRQNAEQYRMLTTTYPFVYGVERTTSVAFASNIVRRQRVDTIALRSADEWRYTPGSVVQRDRRVFWRDGAVTMHIPTLLHFADTVFIANHCFYDGGVEAVDGRDMLRIDFVAAAKIRQPDVDGSMYLDPSTLQIRRTFLRLSKSLDFLPDVTDTEATTLFAELLPSVPVIAAISSVNRLKPITGRRDPPTAMTEEQRLIAVRFTAGRPGDAPGGKPDR